MLNLKIDPNCCHPRWPTRWYLRTMRIFSCLRRRLSKTGPPNEDSKQWLNYNELIEGDEASPSVSPKVKFLRKDNYWPGRNPLRPGLNLKNGYQHMELANLTHTSWEQEAQPKRLPQMLAQALHHTDFRESWTADYNLNSPHWNPSDDEPLSSLKDIPCDNRVKKPGKLRVKVFGVRKFKKQKYRHYKSHAAEPLHVT